MFHFDGGPRTHRPMLMEVRMRKKQTRNLEYSMPLDGMRNLEVPRNGTVTKTKTTTDMLKFRLFVHVGTMGRLVCLERFVSVVDQMSISVLAQAQPQAYSIRNRNPELIRCRPTMAHTMKANKKSMLTR